MQDSRGDGSNVGPIHGGMLPRRWRCESGKVHCGSSLFFPARAEKPVNAETSSGETKSARMAQSGSSEEQIAYPVGGSMSSGLSCVEAKAAADGGTYSPVVCNVPQAFRGLPTSSQRCCVPKPETEKEPSEAGRDPPPIRGGDQFQDTGVRRDCHFGLGSSSVFSGGVATNSHKIKVGGRPPFVRNGAQTCPGVHGEGSTNLESSKPRQFASLPTETRGSLNRFLGEAPHCHGNSKARPVASNGQCPALRKGGPIDPASRITQCRNARHCRMGKRQHRQGVYQPALAVPLSLSSPIFLEIFSGCGALAKTVATVTGWNAGMFDYNFGASYDVRSSHVRGLILGWIRSGMVRAVHLRTPRNSFSRARDAGPGPPPLRSDFKPLGLAGLREADETKVKEGNLYMRFSCQVCRLCLLLRIPFTLENPSTSRLWLCPPVVNLMRRPEVNWIDVDSCAFGMQWRKRTRFLYFGIDLLHLSSHKCDGSKRGLCAFTLQPHLPLMGIAPTGQFFTKMAAAQPKKLCRVLAHALLDWHTRVIAENFWKRLVPEGSATMGQ